MKNIESIIEVCIKQATKKVLKKKIEDLILKADEKTIKHLEEMIKVRKQQLK